MIFDFRIVIPVPREVVWRLVHDPDMRPRWDRRISRYHVDGEPAPGALVTMRLRRILPPKILRARYQVFEAPKTFVLDALEGEPASPLGSGTWVFDDIPEGTRVTCRFHAHKAGAPMLPRGIYTWFLERGAARALRGLRDLAVQAHYGKAGAPNRSYSRWQE